MIGEKKFYKNLKEQVDKPSALRDEQNIQALSQHSTQLYKRVQKCQQFGECCEKVGVPSGGLSGKKDNLLLEQQNTFQVGPIHE